jgi:hypothetical protein
MKKILLIGIVAILVATTIFSGCLQNGTGTLVFKITDAPSDLNITHANITISQVQVHMSAGGGNNTTAGWYTVVNESQTFDLIALLNVTELFGSANLSVGMYTQIRLTVESCVITVDGTEYDCTVPSGAIKLIKPFVLIANQTTTLTLDFDAQKSISETGNHTYKFKPVIKVIQE